MEVYQDQVRDLLINPNEDGTTRMPVIDIRESPSQGIFLEGVRCLLSFCTPLYVGVFMQSALFAIAAHTHEHCCDMHHQHRHKRCMGIASLQRWLNCVCIQN